ncbi:Holliday junction branch migration protein RuvA [candidate division KSB1 bacterium]|nr:Holliday junction branch migration protein RuvA [candidate division KSB1 bacterium]
MINYLQGILVHKSPTKLVVEVNGVAFEVNITLFCYENLGEIGQKTKVLTYLHVREDILQLYGFKTNSERELFMHLISAPGIGPKKAQVILSSVAAAQLQRYIIEEDLSALTSLSGVGKKTAQRLILDLKDKVLSIDDMDRLPRKSEDMQTIDNLIDESVAALTSLGFNKNSAQMVVLKIVRKNNQEISLEELIKQSLQNL